VLTRVVLSFTPVTILQASAQAVDFKVGRHVGEGQVYPVVPPMVEYSLTPMGRLFIEPIEMLYAWAVKNDDALSKLRRRRKKHTASRDKARKVQ